MEKYEIFADLAEKKRFSAEDKAIIEQAAQEYGITLNTGCPNCYHDAAIQIALMLKPKNEPEQETEQANSEYELCDGIDITLHSYKYGELRINKANCTPENARKWREAGIPARFFKKLSE